MPVFLSNSERVETYLPSSSSMYSGQLETTNRFCASERSVAWQVAGSCLRSGALNRLSDATLSVYRDLLTEIAAQGAGGLFRRFDHDVQGRGVDRSH